MNSRSKRVAVIGAGISGIVAAAHLKEEGVGVTVFERSSAAGGIWLYDERPPLEPTYPSIIPWEAERKHTSCDPALNLTEAEFRRLSHAPPGPCYIGLKNNVPTRLLETTLNPFPPKTPDFVSHSVLKEYIQDTAMKMGVHEITRYDTEVKNLSKNGHDWVLEAVTLNHQSTDGVTLTSSVSKFDAIVVASGHYHSPRIPDIPGLAALKQYWPTRIQHSKGYRRPDTFKDKNILLIGASVSSTDIARELGPFARTIYQSHRNGQFDLPASLLPENAIRVSEVVSFDVPPSKSSNIALGPTDPIPTTISLKSGQTLCSIHAIVLCTGYHTALPFLLTHYSPANTPPTDACPTTLITNGMQLHNLHKDIFYIPDSSLLFIGVPYFTATFTLFEFQAMVAAKVVAGKVKLPREDQMRSEYEERVRVKGHGKAFHSLRGVEEEYVDELIGWANEQLEAGERLEGHTPAWKEGKKEQMERLKALFAGDGVEQKELELIC
ncbi:dimethylaniline monooxygenase [Lentithecium fluviatile CBS 122367]|uniref:Dimethylaniline monooxygenase n=1 Tax=Lentithecium fluviatile CBS 122367 TaxID=1168545 RepID=A0A6G1J3C8_9PLEO|nr:dimethylaniline monooxygenase [Lentithecium fluviatile CBS 122367]